MRGIFKDASLEAEFKKNGFLLLPFMSASEAVELQRQLHALRPSDGYEGNQDTLIGKQSFHVTFFDDNAKYKQQVYAQIKTSFEPFADRYFRNYRCAQANVFLKPLGVGFVHPHQNLTIVDEKRFTSVSLWMPTQDTDLENGTICLVPGSHNGFVKYRNTHVYWPYVKFFREGKGFDFFVPVKVKAGEVLVLDDRIVHYTPVNTSAKDRWALHSLWVPAEARLKFYDPGPNQVKVYDVDDHFWQQHQPGQQVMREPDLVLPNDEQLLSESELLTLLEHLRRQTGSIA